MGWREGYCYEVYLDHVLWRDDNSTATFIIRDFLGIRNMTQEERQKGVGVLEYRPLQVPAARRWAGRLLMVCGVVTIVDSLFGIFYAMHAYRAMMAVGSGSVFWYVIAFYVGIGVWGGFYLLLRKPCRNRRRWATTCGITMAITQGGFWGFYLVKHIPWTYCLFERGTVKLSSWILLCEVAFISIRIFLVVALAGLVVSLFWVTAPDEMAHCE